MSLYPGKRVKLADSGGRDGERTRAMQVMGDGTYTVEMVKVEGWFTTVYLEEFPGVIFNSCVLQEVEDEDPDIYSGS